MQWRSVSLVFLAVALACAPGIVSATDDGQDVHKQGSANASSGLGLGAPVMETAYNALAEDQQDAIDPYKKVNIREYVDALAALKKMHDEGTISQSRYDEILAMYPNAREAFRKLGITFDTYAKSSIGPMYARSADQTRRGGYRDYWWDLFGRFWRLRKGARSTVPTSDVSPIKMILAIDKTKPITDTTRTVMQRQTVECPATYVPRYHPGTNILAGVYISRPGGPCYQWVPTTVTTGGEVSVVKYPAQLVPDTVTTETSRRGPFRRRSTPTTTTTMVWRVTVPDNQISPVTGEDLGDNQFIVNPPNLSADQTTVRLSTDRHGNLIGVSSDPPVVGSPDGTPVVTGTTTQPVMPRRRGWR